MLAKPAQLARIPFGGWSFVAFRGAGVFAVLPAIGGAVLDLPARAHESSPKRIQMSPLPFVGSLPLVAPQAIVGYTHCIFYLVQVTKPDRQRSTASDGDIK